jgi:two-component system sensor histidine kinase/response regulator
LVKFSLRTKALVLILLVTAGAQAIVGYGNYSAAKSTIIDTTIDKAGTKVQNTADKLASWIATRRAEAEVMSRTDQVRFGSGPERLAYFRGELERSGSPFVTIGFADPAGRTELSSGEVIHIAEEPSFDAAMKGKVEVTDPFVREEGGASVIVIQVPVYGKDNEIIGVLDVALSAERIFKELLHVQIGKSDVVLLYDDGASMIEKESLQQAEDSAKSLDLPQSALEQMRAKLSGYVRRSGNTGDAFLFYGAVEGTAWHIALNVPLQEIEAPLSSIKRHSILSIAVAEAVLTLLFFLFSQPIISRIKRILSVTEAAAAGRFDVNNVSDEGGDELSQLSNSVNQMKLHLSGMFGQMDAMINQNQFAFIVLDSEYRVTYFSRTAEQLLGYKAEEVLHKATVMTFIDPQDVAKEARRLSGKYGRPIPADITVFELLRKEQFTYEREWK